jgi:hypothetical protein
MAFLFRMFSRPDIPWHCPPHLHRTAFGAVQVGQVCAALRSLAPPATIVPEAKRVGGQVCCSAGEQSPNTTRRLPRRRSASAAARNDGLFPIRKFVLYFVHANYPRF